MATAGRVDQCIHGDEAFESKTSKASDQDERLNMPNRAQLRVSYLRQDTCVIRQPKHSEYEVSGRSLCCIVQARMRDWLGTVRSAICS